jgi:hypothetical protein
MFKYSLSWPDVSAKHYFNHSIYPSQKAAMRAGRIDRDMRIVKDKERAASIHVWSMVETEEEE